jgi:hypothetical protein
MKYCTEHNLKYTGAICPKTPVSGWEMRSVGCHWTHPKYPSAVVSSVIKRGQDGAQFSGYVAVVNFAEIGTFHTRELAQQAIAAHLDP